jgi:peroxiredoxin
MQGVVLSVLLVLEALTLISLWVLVYQLVKQQGRILLRLDELDSHTAHTDHGITIKPETADGLQSGANGLPIGTRLPPFNLPDLSGNRVSLENFLGKQVLLINWDPECGYCEMISPILAGLRSDFRERNVQLLLASRGDLEPNRALAQEYGLEDAVILQTDSERVEPFENDGSPVAYFLDEQGRVSRPFADGADQVIRLAQEVATGRQGKRKKLRGQLPLAESNIERGGLKSGSPAPSFSLPDVYGRTISLADYRGRRVLLVFSDPHCGPCDQLAPHLARFDRRQNDKGFSVVMVGRGDPEENRLKAERYGFEFPVVVQRKWELSKQYGIFATPVAFLISEDGLIARDVAVGIDEIMSLGINEQAVAIAGSRKGE